MLARWAARRVFWLPLSAIQRALFYATVAVAAAQSYQHASYPMTIQDKRGIAKLLRSTKIGPSIERSVEIVMREMNTK